MRRLEAGEIEILASRRGVRKIAVENFLATITANPDRYCAVQNAYYDQRLYGWNNTTIKAILDGIELSCRAEVALK